MPLSAYERAIRKGRRDLLKVDSKVRTELARAYEVSKRDMLAEVQRISAIPTPAEGPGRQFQIDRLTALGDQVADELTRLADQSAPVIAAGQREAAYTAAQAVQGQVQAVAPALEGTFMRLPVRAIENIVGQMSNGSPLRTLLNANGLKNGKAARDLLSSAVAQGKNPRAITRELARILDRNLWEAETIARDAVLDASRLASLQTYDENDDIIDGWRWNAALSERTCLVCLALHGRVFSLKHKFFPRHRRCRCCPSPVLKEAFGPMPVMETGTAWLARQPEAVRRAKLPNALFDEYEAGSVQLADFVMVTNSPKWGPGYRVAPIDQVRANAERRGSNVIALPPIPRPRVAAALPPRDEPVVSMGRVLR